MVCALRGETNKACVQIEMTGQSYQEYEFANHAESHMHRHFMPHVLAFAGRLLPNMRVLDIGCGNGFLCGEFLKCGCKVVGIDLSGQGIELARRNYSGARFELIEANANILDHLGEEPFDLVVSTEVVEHLYRPRDWAKGCYMALKRGGTFICTTPYHSYFKNLLISLVGKWDTHANPLWDGGHIKLWSRRTLSTLLTETGFKNLEFRRAGRWPGFWMTMIVGAKKPL
jgi:2-polyprenyl-3-methyl-5-hydroxy-6-metoxy-1,4-benzoquinol methylase